MYLLGFTESQLLYHKLAQPSGLPFSSSTKIKHSLPFVSSPTTFGYTKWANQCTAPACGNARVIRIIERALTLIPFNPRFQTIMKLSALAAIALAGPLLVAAASNAAVYDFLIAEGSRKPVPEKYSLLYLAEKLGIDNHYAFGHDDKAIEFLAEEHTGAVLDLPPLVVVLRGVDLPSQLFASREPSFEVNFGKDGHAFTKSLLKKFPKQLAENVGISGASELSEEIKIVTQNDTLLDQRMRQFRAFKHSLPQKWDSAMATLGSSVQNVIGRRDAGLRLINDKLYINELMQMVELQSVAQKNGEALFVNLDSLLSIGAKTGFDSKTYKVAKGALLDALIALHDGRDLTVVAFGLDHKVADESTLAKRSRELASDFSAFSKRGAVAEKSCFESEDACTLATNSCNKHGKCVKIQSKCWQCACTLTYDKKTSKTTSWAGYDCSKKDIAAQAHLLLWTSVALLVTLVGGVKLLYSIGSESLPGVLQAATVDTSRS